MFRQLTTDLRKLYEDDAFFFLSRDIKNNSVLVF